MQITTISVILLNIIAIIVVNGYLDYEIIEGYLKEKRTNYAIIIGCFGKTLQLKIVKNFGLNRPVSVLNINNIKVESLETKHDHIGVVLDGDCQDCQDFLIKCGTYKYFDVKHHWLVLTSKNNFISLFQNVLLYINADIHVVYPKRDISKISKNYTIETIYNPSRERGGTLKHNIIGFYNKKEGYRARERECKYWIRRNMTEVILKTIIVLPVPFEGSLEDYLVNEEKREINTFNRFHYNLLLPCEHYYNFTANITLEKSWGYKNKDNTFDGLVGALERKTVDYGSSPLFVRTDRANVMEYGRRTWTLRAAFIFRNPKSKNSIKIFIRPLSLSVWILILCSAVMVVFCFKVISLYEKRNMKGCIETSWSYLVICTTGALCQQGMIRTPKCISGRIVILFMFLFSLLIYQFYSASLVSHLLMKTKTTIRSVHDILQSNLGVGCEDILYNRDYFRYTTDKPSQELYYKKILGKKNKSNFLSPKDGLALVKKGRYAFHVELATAYPIIRNTFDDNAICTLREVQMYRTQQMHSNLQKKSPYRDMFDTCLQRLAEHGIMSREIIFWHPAKPECIHSSRKTNILSIDLDDFYPALGLLGIGISLSLFILIIEIIVNYKEISQREANYIVPIHPFIQ